MQLTQSVSVQAIAKQFGATIIGDNTLAITGINEIHHVKSGDLTFVDHPKYYKSALSSAATVILIDRETNCPSGKVLLVVERPFEVYNSLVQQFHPWQPIRFPFSHDAVIGAGTLIEPGAIIGPNVRIGRDCVIHANAYIGEFSELGDRVVVQPGAIIGGDAFYFKKTHEGYVKWRSGGHVVLEDDVDIGPACTIAKGVSSATRIGAGSKLDAQCQIGHDVKIGKRCLLAAQVGIAGNTTLGNDVTLYGQVGIAQNLHLADGVTVLAQSGVGCNIEAGKTYFGSPAIEARDAFRDLITLRNLRQK